MGGFLSEKCSHFERLECHKHLHLASKNIRQVNFLTLTLVSDSNTWFAHKASECSP